MTSRIRALIAPTVAAALLALASAFAAEVAHAQAFVGASAGRTGWKDVECGNTVACDRKDTGWTIRGGYQYTPWFGVEGRYFDLGKAHTAIAAGDGGGPVSADFSAKGFGIDVVLSWPVSDRVSISGIAGVARSEAKSDFPERTVDSAGATITQVGIQQTHRGTKPYYGLGVAFGVTPQLFVSLEAERYRIDFGGSSTASVDMLGAGLVYRFR
jgi:OOP family OmpA-OmpF porin